jgi:hypothetical protein
LRISFEGSCSPPHRAAEKAAAAGPSDDEEEDDPPAPSDVENPSGDDDDEPKPKSKPKKKGKGKGKGGIIVPEEWPWEDAKKVFEKPDVTPADDIEVWLNYSLIFNSQNTLQSWNGPTQMWMGSFSS